jgi:hypothetical protein
MRPTSTPRVTLTAIAFVVLCAACGEIARNVTGPDDTPVYLRTGGDPVGGGGGGGGSGSTGCIAGYYQVDSLCFQADPGHYVPFANATAQNACVLGYYQPDSAQTACLLADVDFYVDSTGSATQTPCPAGTTTGGNGATSVDQCVSTSVATTTTLTPDTNNPTHVGTPVTFTAAVTETVGGAPVVTGNVKFIEGGTCAAPTVTRQAAAVVDADGKKTFSTSALAAGSHTIEAC